MNYSGCPPPTLYSEHMPEAHADCEPPRLIIPTCNHILESGRLCRCAASRGQRFCRHHIDLRARRLRMLRAERQIRLRFRMPLLQDMPAVQLARARVRYAMEAGHLEPATGRQVLWGLGLASSNARFMEEQARRELEEKSDDRRAASERSATTPVSPSKSIKYGQLLRNPVVASKLKGKLLKIHRPGGGV